MFSFGFLEKYINKFFFSRFACFAGSGVIVWRTVLTKAREIWRNFAITVVNLDTLFPSAPSPLRMVILTHTHCRHSGCSMPASRVIIAYVVSMCRGYEFCKLFYLQSARAFEQELPWKQTWHLSKGTSWYSCLLNSHDTANGHGFDYAAIIYGKQIWHVLMPNMKCFWLIIILFSC